jgi:hypothetical protein
MEGIFMQHFPIRKASLIPPLIAAPFTSISLHAAFLMRLASALFALFTVSLASAQTAHFSGVQSTLGSGMSLPNGMAIDGSGNVYINDSGNQQVLKETISPGGLYPDSCAELRIAWRRCAQRHRGRWQRQSLHHR